MDITLQNWEEEFPKKWKTCGSMIHRVKTLLSQKDHDHAVLVETIIESKNREFVKALDKIPYEDYSGISYIEPKHIKKLIKKYSN